MFTTLPGAVGGAASDSVVLALGLSTVPHVSLLRLRWCYMGVLCYVVIPFKQFSLEAHTFGTS